MTGDGRDGRQLRLRPEQAARPGSTSAWRIRRGCTTTTEGNTHEVAQAIAPRSRIVYVDNDPIVLSHATALLKSAPGGACQYVQADIREPGKILDEAARTLDFSQPVAVMILMTLQYVPDADDPHQIVRTLMDAVPPGSYLTISDVARDLAADANVEASTERLNERRGRCMIMQ